MRVETANHRSTAVGAASAYRVGELGVIQVARRLPRKLGANPSVGAGASVWSSPNGTASSGCSPA